MSRPDPTKRLTDLELEIMKVAWEAGPAPLTVRDVVERLQAGGRSLAYTSVQTVMNILKRKGVLSSRPGPGRAHEYHARLSQEDATRSMTREFVDRLFGGDAEGLLAHLLEHESVPRSELERLRDLIERSLADDGGVG